MLAILSTSIFNISLLSAVIYLLPKFVLVTCYFNIIANCHLTDNSPSNFPQWFSNTCYTALLWLFRNFCFFKIKYCKKKKHPHKTLSTLSIQLIVSLFFIHTLISLNCNNYFRTHPNPSLLLIPTPPIPQLTPLTPPPPPHPTTLFSMNADICLPACSCACLCSRRLRRWTINSFFCPSVCSLAHPSILSILPSSNVQGRVNSVRKSVHGKPHPSTGIEVSLQAFTLVLGTVPAGTCSRNMFSVHTISCSLNGF